MYVSSRNRTSACQTRMWKKLEYPNHKRYISNSSSVATMLWESVKRLFLATLIFSCCYWHFYTFLISLLIFSCCYWQLYWFLNTMVHYSRRNRIKEFISYLSYTLELHEYPNPYWYGIPSHLFDIPSTKKSSQIVNKNIAQDISATVFQNFVYERSNWANSSDLPPLYIHQILTDIFGVFQLRSAIYISVRSHGLYNAFFSSFYFIEINNDLFLLVRCWKQRQQFIVPWKTASRHCSVQRLWLDVFHAGQLVVAE